MKDLKTENLILRKLRATDYLAIYNNYASDAEVVKYLTWDVHKNSEETKQIVNEMINQYSDLECFRWVICESQSDEAIGMIDVVEMNVKVPSIGYVLAKQYWGKHYMSEALDAVCNYLFEIGYPAIEGKCDLRNLGSAKVMMNNGFTKVGVNQMIVKEKSCEIAFFIINNV